MSNRSLLQSHGSQTQNPPAAMKSIAIVALALACVLGLATAQFGYAPQQSGGFGSGGLLALIGLLFLLLTLFGNNTTSGDTTIIYGNYSGPTTR